MQLERPADTVRFQTTDRFSQPTDPAAETTQFNADFAEALRWLRSCRVTDVVAFQGKKKPILQHDTRSLNESLHAASIDSAVIWIEGDQSLAALNEKARQWLGIDDSMLGERFALKLNRTAARLCELSDQMLQIGTPTVQYEFESSTDTGEFHRWSIRKARLAGILTTGIGCLWVARSLAPATEREISSLAVLEEQFALFESLDEIGRTICQGIALGDTTSEIACSVGLTRRSVEVRRAKILELFGFARKVQIVRMMVRFEENGCFGT